MLRSTAAVATFFPNTSPKTATALISRFAATGDSRTPSTP